MDTHNISKEQPGIRSIYEGQCQPQTGLLPQGGDEEPGPSRTPTQPGTLTAHVLTETRNHSPGTRQGWAHGPSAGAMPGHGVTGYSRQQLSQQNFSARIIPQRL